MNGDGRYGHDNGGRGKRRNARWEWGREREQGGNSNGDGVETREGTYIGNGDGIESSSGDGNGKREGERNVDGATKPIGHIKYGTYPVFNPELDVEDDLCH